MKWSWKMHEGHREPPPREPSSKRTQWGPHPPPDTVSELLRFISRRAHPPQSATPTGSAVSNRLRAGARDKSRFRILDRWMGAGVGPDRMQSSTGGGGRERPSAA